MIRVMFVSTRTIIYLYTEFVEVLVMLDTMFDVPCVVIKYTMFTSISIGTGTWNSCTHNHGELLYCHHLIDRRMDASQTN